MDRRDMDLDRAELAPLGDLVALWTATNPEGLWQAIVVHGGGSTTDHWLAVRLFRRHHEDGAPGALTTALLLCTDGAGTGTRAA
jgi:triacylglycerol esterase/lipase EstA (alpha/beta hydrolase family)